MDAALFVFLLSVQEQPRPAPCLTAIPFGEQGNIVILLILYRRYLRLIYEHPHTHLLLKNGFQLDAFVRILAFQKVDKSRHHENRGEEREHWQG